MNIKSALATFFKRYFFIVGILCHVFVVGFIALKPDLFFKVTDKVLEKYYSTAKQAERAELLKFPSIKDEIAAVFPGGRYQAILPPKPIC